MSAEATLALSTVPLIKKVASATSGSGFEELRSWINSTSARETLRPSPQNLPLPSTFSPARRPRAAAPLIEDPGDSLDLFGRVPFQRLRDRDVSPLDRYVHLVSFVG